MQLRPKGVLDRVLGLFRKETAQQPLQEGQQGKQTAHQIPVSGLEFCAGRELVPELRIEDSVRLIREPNNAYDRNAIRIETNNGQHVGYINRDAARDLAPVMDGGATVAAYVTAIEGGAYATKTCLTVGVLILGDKAGIADLPVDDMPTAYCMDRRKDDVYVMINGSDQAVRNVVTELQKRGLSCKRHAPSTRLSRDGHQYDWFMVFDSDAARYEETNQSIAHIFAEHWGLHTKAEWDRASMLDSLLASERKRLTALEAERKAIDDLFDESSKDAEHEREQRKRLETELAETNLRCQQLEATKESEVALRNRLSRHTEEVNRIVKTLVPSIHDVRDSLTEAIGDLQDPLPLMKQLREIDRDIHSVNQKADRFKGTRDWRELRFNRGNDDQGRLYYRMTKTGAEVLISDKKRQNMDERYLSRF